LESEGERVAGHSAHVFELAGGVRERGDKTCQKINRSSRLPGSPRGNKEAAEGQQNGNTDSNKGRFGVVAG
jgi:hypothetical protein